MWTSTLDLDPKRILLTQVLGRFYHGAYFSSYAPLRVENLPRQTLPAANWVRVRNRLAGICGSDLHFIFADGDLRIAPAALPGPRHFYLGHEVIGEVIEVGDEVRQIRIGDRVVLQSGLNCLTASIPSPCRSCAAGNYCLCEYGTLPGPEPIGGGWSEEMLLHELQLYPIPPSISDEQAVMLEPTAVALHALLRHVPQPGEKVLVIGGGTIGLLTLQLLRLLTPQAEISMMTHHAFQVEQATRLGAAHIIYPQAPYSGVQKATGAKLFRGLLGNQAVLGGYDVIYDTVGTRKSIHHALRWASARSTVVLVGSTLHLMHLDLTPIWHREVTLLGSMGHGMERWPIGSSQQRSTFSIASELIELGHIRPERLVTHHFALNDYKIALLTASSKANSQAIKVVFDYALLPASVVPNVRASARQRHPATITRPFGPVEEPEELPVTPMPSVPVSALTTAQEEAQASPAPQEETASPAPASKDETEADTEVALPAVIRAARAARKKIASDVRSLVEVEARRASSTRPATPPPSQPERIEQIPTIPTIPVPVIPDTPDAPEQPTEASQPEPVPATDNTSKQSDETDRPVIEAAPAIYEQPTEAIEQVSEIVSYPSGVDEPPVSSDVDEPLAISDVDTQPVSSYVPTPDEPPVGANADVQAVHVDEPVASYDATTYEMPPHVDEPLVLADELPAHLDEPVPAVDGPPSLSEEPVTGVYELPSHLDELLVSADPFPADPDGPLTAADEPFAVQDETLPPAVSDPLMIADSEQLRAEEPSASEIEQSPELIEPASQESSDQPAENSAAISIAEPDALTATPAPELSDLQSPADAESTATDNRAEEAETNVASEPLPNTDQDKDQAQNTAKRARPRRKKNTRNLQ